MFADLLSLEIQPEEIDAAYVPEIELSDELIEDITQMLVKEEGKYVNVRKHTVIVQSDKNYVFFSNQWLYLAVACKKYAEALYPYCQFFDNKIRTNINHIWSIAEEDYNNPNFSSLFKNDEDKNRMLRFIKGDSDFRPGKNLINGDKCRGTKDIFGSCVLKKIPVPDASSTYLGNLIYYLVKEKPLFEKLETEIQLQCEKANARIQHKDFKYNILPAVFQNDFARRYIISLLAKPFVILTGNSGTGKTRISKQFAEYLEQKDIKGNKNWLIVPVGADWTDNTKVLGFFNPLANEGKGDYVKTDILKLMERANENKEIPYFLILDEMNLSHVERYFSDFLSHMETPDNPLDIDGYGILEFPKNLFVVGTVNIDETTYMFSPKVLDRANVVEFKPDKQSVMDLFASAETLGKMWAANDGSSQGFLKFAKDIQNQKSTLTEDDISTIRTIFTTVYEELQKCGFEFAYRTVKEIKQYISAAAWFQEEFGEEQLTQAIDEQLLQKVLPKIHGNKKEIGELLAALESICESNALTNSMVKIKQMKGRLEATQYASFI